MRKVRNRTHIVSEDVEIVADGERYLLEKGDRIRINEAYPGATPEWGGRTRLRPATITMKRGTVIEADHVKDLGHMLIVGIGPGRGKAHWHRGVVNRSREFATRERYEGRNMYRQKFGKVLTINKENIQSVR